MSFVNDLIADLKDRNLLPVAIAMLAGCFVLPFAISMSGSGGSDGVVSTPTPEPLDALPEAQLAAVVTDSGIREYSRRLDDFKQRNPFKQQFPAKIQAEGTAANESPDVGPGPGSTTPPPSPTPSSDGGGGSITPGSGSAGSSSSGGSGGGFSTETSTSTEQFFYNFRATVKFGKKGELKDKKILPVAALPNDNKPVVLYLGPSSADSDKAVFAISANEYVDGDGTCLSDNEKVCFYVEMGAEDKIEIKSLLDGNVYQLKLKTQELVEADKAGARASKRVIKKTTRRTAE